MSNKFFTLGLSLFAVACLLEEKDDTGGALEPSTEPSSEPSSQPSSEPSASPTAEPTLYILSNYWAGEATVVVGESYDGWESFDKNDGTYDVDGYNCMLVWDVTGAPSADTTGCEDCVFAFDLTTSPQEADYIVDDGTCSFSEYTFGYGYVADYQGSASVFYQGQGEEIGEFGAWIIDGYQPFEGYESSVVFDEASGNFSYAQGYRNYEYLYYY